MKFVKIFIAILLIQAIITIKVANKKNGCDETTKKVANKVYSCVKKLGSGNQGTVYLVKDSAGKQFAFKQTIPEDMEIIKKNFAIYEAYKKVNSKYVMKIYECSMKKGELDENGKRQGYLKLLLEPINGGILFDYKFTSGSDLLEKYLMLIKGLVDLDKARILHNDIKADNIMIDTTTGDLKIIDFDNSILFSKNPEEIEEVLKSTRHQQMRESIYNFLYSTFNSVPFYDLSLSKDSESQKLLKKLNDDGDFRSIPDLAKFVFTPDEFNCMKFIIRSSLSSQNYFRNESFVTSFVNETVPATPEKYRQIFQSKKK